MQYLETQKFSIQILKNTIFTRQHPQGGGREALSNPFWFLFIVNVQYEYNWIRLRQLTYLVRSQKWTKNGTLEPGISALKSVSGGPFFGHLLIWPDAGGGARRRTLAPGGPEERNRRFAQKIFFPGSQIRWGSRFFKIAIFQSNHRIFYVPSLPGRVMDGEGPRYGIQDNNVI